MYTSKIALPKRGYNVDYKYILCGPKLVSKWSKNKILKVNKFVSVRPRRRQRVSGRRDITYERPVEQEENTVH